MIEIATNPTLETLKLVLWIACALIVMLLAIVSYFIRIHFSGEKGRMNKISEVVDTLKETVANLKGIVEIIKKEQEDRETRTERRLNEHSRRIGRHDRQLVRIETKIEIQNTETEGEYQ